MNRIRAICNLSVMTLALGGCAVTQLEPVAKNVKVISEQESKNCKFINTITTNNLNTLSENPEEDARNRAFNRAAEQGGNAIRVLGTNVAPAHSGVGSILTMTSEIYSCGASTPVAPPVSPVQTPPPQDAAAKGIADAFSLKDAQRVLNGKGYDAGAADGVAGKKTRAALEKFQRDNGLPPTGTLTSETKTLLQSAK